MSYIRLANLFQVFPANGTTDELRFFNSLPGEVLAYDGMRWPYLSFIYQGAAKNRTGDNLEAQLVLPVNDLSNGFAYEAVRDRKRIKVYSVVMDDDTFGNTVNRVLATEEWLASSLSYDNEKLEVLLSSAIDAVGANAPTRVLTRELVGHLPVSASIQTL